MADSLETAAGASPHLVFLTGAPPANCAAAETGTRLSNMTLPADWLTNPGDGTKAILGTWDSPSALAAGTIGYFRIYNTAESSCKQQGSVTLTGGGGVMTVDNTNVQPAQDIKITGYTLTVGNT